MKKIIKKLTEHNAHNAMVRIRNLERLDKHDKLRNVLSDYYLSGTGIEIGALHKPLYINNEKAEVIYLDRMKIKKLQKQYPEVTEPMVNVDIVDDGEKLSKIKKGSLDFVIACHFYEHTANPIQTTKNLIRVLKKGGIVFIAIPNKEHTFDIDRELTSFSHIINDYNNGPEQSKARHYNEWVDLVYKIEDKAKREKTLSKILKQNYSIHYHVWNYDSFVDYIFKLQKFLNNAFITELVARNHSEVIAILKKI